jgi:transcriptional regulator
MYVPPIFKADDAKCWAFVEQRGFGSLIAIDDGFPIAAHVPLLVVRDGDKTRIEMHLARANPLHAIIARAPNVLITVQGPDAYVSPDWYTSKDQVPTWNYIAVHMKGRARVLPDEAKWPHVDRLSDTFEARLAPKPIWKSSKMTQQKREMLIRAIVAIEIDVLSIDGSWKLAQTKTRSDRMEVARMLEWRGDADGQSGARGISEAMKQSLKE